MVYGAFSPVMCAQQKGCVCTALESNCEIKFLSILNRKLRIIGILMSTPTTLIRFGELRDCSELLLGTQMIFLSCTFSHKIDY